jgi:hypothetical protein
LQTTVPAPMLRQAGADWILRSCADIRVIEGEADLKLILNEA